jgi:hypothetical protein
VSPYGFYTGINAIRFGYQPHLRAIPYEELFQGLAYTLFVIYEDGAEHPAFKFFDKGKHNFKNSKPDNYFVSTPEIFPLQHPDYFSIFLGGTFDVHTGSRFAGIPVVFSEVHNRRRDKERTGFF